LRIDLRERKTLTLLKQITANSSPGAHYENDDAAAQAPANPLVRLIAFYLPQFHAIPENDLWWGTGFTEWTNVTKAIPRFSGHYQPRLPGALGFYDATHADVLSRQAELAKKYGIRGFCFHHYWFQGQRILEKPLETLLANPNIDLPFCVNWANENWTRRWDGLERTILLQQNHTKEDSLAFARALEPLFADKRYIRINGRPLLLIYRPGLIPDPTGTVAIWREHFISAGFGNPYIAMVQRHGDGDAARYDMDAAVGFPPFYSSAGLPVRKDLHLFDKQYHGLVRNYQLLADATIAGYDHEPRTFPGVAPSWDNEARKPGQGTCFTASTPGAYGRWLHAACQTSLRNFEGDERLVFINAWNEWAEGAYLEPDRHFGFAYLAETRRILTSLSTEVPPASAFSDISRWTTKRTPKSPARRITRKTLNYLANWAEEIAWKLRGR
jgi:lipopolysaccharide biosynthesis protein